MIDHWQQASFKKMYTVKPKPPVGLLCVPLLQIPLAPVAKDSPQEKYSLFYNLLKTFQIIEFYHVMCLKMLTCDFFQAKREKVSQQRYGRDSMKLPSAIHVCKSRWGWGYEIDMKQQNDNSPQFTCCHPHWLSCCQLKSEWLKSNLIFKCLQSR